MVGDGSWVKPNAFLKGAFSRRETWQYVFALVALVLTAYLAAGERWPFDGPAKPPAEASVWETVLYHGAVLGFLRLGLVMVVLYAIVSVPALVVGGRWVKGFTTTGLAADDVESVNTAIKDVEEKNRRLVQDNRELLSLLEEATRPH